MGEVVSFAERQDRPPNTQPHPLRDALDALALALADHGHVWADRERALYETALDYLGLPP